MDQKVMEKLKKLLALAGSPNEHEAALAMSRAEEIMRRVYNPEKVKAQVLAEMEEKRKAQRRGVQSTVVREVDSKTGETVEHSVSASEMNRRRLEYARKLDEERYRDERTTPLAGC